MHSTDDIFELFSINDKLSVIITDLRGNVLIETVCDFPVHSPFNESSQFADEFGKLPVITIVFDGQSNMGMEFPVAHMAPSDTELVLTGPKGVATFKFINK